MKRELSQQEIDAVFQRSGESTHESSRAVTPVDFSRLDRIPKSLIRAVHLLHEDFSRNSSANLSAYLRARVTMNLVSLEQISYVEFLGGLASPTFIAFVGLRPYDGSAVMELNPGLVFTFVEMLLGGDARTAASPQRKTTEIEKNLMRNLLRIMLQDLGDAWKNVADIRFAVQSVADEPQGLSIFSPSEAVVAIGIEVTAGTTTGMINFAIPSIFIKRLRHMFERLRRVQHAESKHRDQMHVANLLMPVGLDFEARLDGLTISTGNLLSLEVGDVLALEAPLHQRIAASLNGEPKFLGEVGVSGAKLMFEVDCEQERD